MRKNYNPLTYEQINDVIEALNFKWCIVRGSIKNLTELLWPLERDLARRHYIPAASKYKGSSIACSSIIALADFFWPNNELSDRYYPTTRGFKINHRFSLSDRYYIDFCHVVARSMNQAYGLDSKDDYSHPMPWRANESVARHWTCLDELQVGNVVFFDYNDQDRGGRKSGVVSGTGLFLFNCENHQYGYYKRLVQNCYKMNFKQHRIDQRHVHRFVQLALLVFNSKLSTPLVFYILKFNEGVLSLSILHQAIKKIQAYSSATAI